MLAPEKNPAGQNIVLQPRSEKDAPEALLARDLDTLREHLTGFALVDTQANGPRAQAEYRFVAPGGQKLRQLNLVLKTPNGTLAVVATGADDAAFAALRDEATKIGESLGR
jgi:hypothetical protein